MTLIQLIGVLAILAILAGVVVPLSLRKLDQIASDKETAELKALGEAFVASVMRNRYVPCHTNWAQAIASERGVNLTDVTSNLRRQPRVFLVDPALRIGTRVAGQDYSQDSAGSVITNASGHVIPPINPRMILLSSIGVPLPAGITNGVPASTNDFNAIWNVADGALPGGGLWTGWAGARDLKIQRINLSGAFVHITLSSYLSDTNGIYVIAGSTPLEAPTPPVPGRDAYFIQSSVLELRTHTNTLDTLQILNRDISYVYWQNVWRTDLGGGFIGGLDIGTIVDRFLRAPHNPVAQNTTNQQVIVVQAMMEYMQAYQDWEAVGFGNNAWRTAALAKQDAMMDAVQGLYKHPSYSPPEVICPP
jgi:hypothetical protein